MSAIKSCNARGGSLMGMRRAARIGVYFMRKKIMGIGIGLLTMTAVIWGYQNYKKSVPDGNEAVQSEKTVKRTGNGTGKIQCGR